jgi:DNA-binding MarR family transcriptional regulator
MSRKPLADKVWHGLTRLVMDNKDTWRRAVVAETGLPLSRVRILMRLARQPLTVKKVAAAADIDAPAATVAVNDLEDRGLVVRETDPANRRCKLVSLTPAGRKLVAAVREIDDPAPPVVAAVCDKDLRTLEAILDRISSPRPTPARRSARKLAR